MAAVRFSTPHVDAVGAQAPLTRRVWELMVGRQQHEKFRQELLQAGDRLLLQRGHAVRIRLVEEQIGACLIHQAHVEVPALARVVH